MPAPKNDIDVRRHLAGLLSHEASVDEFIDWFQLAYREIDERAPDDDYDLAVSINSWLYEFADRHIDEAELFRGLVEDAEEFGVEWRPAAAVVGTSRLAS